MIYISEKENKKIIFDYKEFMNWFNENSDYLERKLTNEQCNPKDGRVYQLVDNNGNIVTKFNYWFGPLPPDQGEYIVVHGKIIVETYINKEE